MISVSISAPVLCVSDLSPGVVDPLACQAVVCCRVRPQLTGSLDGWLPGLPSQLAASSGSSRGTASPPPGGTARLQAGLASVPRGTLNINTLTSSELW